MRIEAAGADDDPADFDADGDGDERDAAGHDAAGLVAAPPVARRLTPRAIPMPTDTPGERLQKVLAEAGLASRRQAEQWIRDGRVTVNGQPAVLGQRLQPRDELRVDGRPVRPLRHAGEARGG